jgi:uncharacterized protein (DUF302 family)
MTGPLDSSNFGETGGSGLVTHASKYAFVETLARLERAIDATGDFKVIYKVDHAAAAAGVGSPIRPMVLVLFANPKSGSALQTAAPTIGLDLPMRALVWENESGKVFVTMNSALWLLDRHGLGARAEVISKLASLVEKLSRAATE